MIRRIVASALLAGLTILAVFAASGCTRSHKIAIESNTCWIAKIDKQAAATSQPVTVRRPLGASAAAWAAAGAAGSRHARGRTR